MIKNAPPLVAPRYDYHGCDEDTSTFTGHAMALQESDDYINKPCISTMNDIKLYAYSVQRYGSSPYIYPEYGLGGLPEAFSRLSAIYGGVYMLNRPVDEILYDESGRAGGIKSQGETARCKMIIGAPSSFAGTGKTKKVERVARCICLLKHPIANTG